MILRNHRSVISTNIPMISMDWICTHQILIKANRLLVTKTPCQNPMYIAILPDWAYILLASTTYGASIIFAPGVHSSSWCKLTLYPTPVTRASKKRESNCKASTTYSYLMRQGTNDLIGWSVDNYGVSRVMQQFVRAGNNHHMLYNLAPWRKGGSTRLFLDKLHLKPFSPAWNVEEYLRLEGCVVRINIPPGGV